ncbi:hypothetical protein MCAG_00563 [Micromonospora sp. ATCC 39149]|nr:hypothetical protein MCAG_00563 [Micromonospora sp. ATCC 39149]
MAGTVDLWMQDARSAEARLRRSVQVHLTRARGQRAIADARLVYPVEALALAALRQGRAYRCLALLTMADALSADRPRRVPAWWMHVLADARSSAHALLGQDEAERISAAVQGFTFPRVVSYIIEGVDELARTESCGLTQRQLEIAVLVTKGFSTSEISGFLGITKSTISSHIRQMYYKLGIRSRTELAAWVASCQPGLYTNPPGSAYETYGRTHPGRSAA